MKSVNRHAQKCGNRFFGHCDLTAYHDKAVVGNFGVRRNNFRRNNFARFGIGYEIIFDRQKRVKVSFGVLVCFFAFAAAALRLTENNQIAARIFVKRTLIAVVKRINVGELVNQITGRRRVQIAKPLARQRLMHGITKKRRLIFDRQFVEQQCAKSVFANVRRKINVVLVSKCHQPVGRCRVVVVVFVDKRGNVFAIHPRHNFDAQVFGVGNLSVGRFLEVNFSESVRRHQPAFDGFFFGGGFVASDNFQLRFFAARLVNAANIVHVPNKILHHLQTKKTRQNF